MHELNTEQREQLGELVASLLDSASLSLSELSPLLLVSLDSLSLPEPEPLPLPEPEPLPLELPLELLPLLLPLSLSLPLPEPLVLESSSESLSDMFVLPCFGFDWFSSTIYG